MKNKSNIYEMQVRIITVFLNTKPSSTRVKYPKSNTTSKHIAISQHDHSYVFIDNVNKSA